MRTRYVWVLGIGIFLAFGIAARGGGSTRSSSQNLASDRAAEAVSLRSSDFPPAWSSSPGSNATSRKARTSHVAERVKLRTPPPGGPTPGGLVSVAPTTKAETSLTFDSMDVLDAYYAYYAYLTEQFAELRQCESSGNYEVDTGNGYYGAYQFDEPTWLGLGYSGYPDDAPPAVQDEAAERLQAQRGWEPWPTCSWVLGL